MTVPGRVAGGAVTPFVDMATSASGLVPARGSAMMLGIRGW